MRLHLAAVIVPSLAALLLAAPTASAQTQTLVEPPKPRQGYYVAGGMMGVVHQTWDKGDGLSPAFGTVTAIRIGQLITRRFGLGLQIDTGQSSSKHVKSTMFDLGLEAHFEVFRNVAAYGGIGLGVASIEDDRDPDAGLRAAFGTAYAVGVSYDWFPGKRASGGFSISPKLMARFIPGEDIKAFVGLVGLELCYWTGLPKNQLDLSGPDAYRK